MQIPNVKVTITHSGTAKVYEREAVMFGSQIVRLENGFDSATILLTNEHSKNYKEYVNPGDTLKIEAKNESDSSWTTIFNGIITNVLPSSPNHTLKIVCVGAGYGLSETACNQEYGSYSAHPTLDTLKEILTDASYGIIPKYANKILGSATDSGYNYTTEIEDISGLINFLHFPYKPNNKSLSDLCNLIQAIKGANAGPHWIVTTGNKLLVTTVGNHHAGAESEGWTTYYGDSQANATLEQGEDFTSVSFEEAYPLKNYIVYAGAWRHPTNGDGITEENSLLWGSSNVILSDSSDQAQVGLKSLKSLTTNGSNAHEIWYPSSMNLTWDLTKAETKDVTPSLSFWLMRPTLGSGFDVSIFKTRSGTIHWFTENFDTTFTPTVGTWYRFILPLGPNWRNGYCNVPWSGWAVVGSPSWTEINGVNFRFYGAVGAGDIYYIDGLNFNGRVIRIAKNSTSITNKHLRLRLITDDIGKDDSLKASDDSGTMARMAYAELLRLQTAPLIGTLTVPMLPGLLPGQLVHIHAEKKSDGSFRIDKDMRVLQVTQNFDMQNPTSIIEVTDDIKNSYARPRYNDLNAVLADTRPEFQDRQSSSMKAAGIDITQHVLECDYPS